MISSEHRIPLRHLVTCRDRSHGAQPGEPCVISEPLPSLLPPPLPLPSPPPRFLILPSASLAMCPDCLPSILGGTHFLSPLSSYSVRHKNLGCCSPYLISLLSPGLDLTFQEVRKALHSVFSSVQYHLGRKQTVSAALPVGDGIAAWMNGWNSQLPACNRQAPWLLSPITKAPSKDKNPSEGRRATSGAPTQASLLSAVV